MRLGFREESPTVVPDYGENVERGAVYTKPEVVEFILDLVGYDAGDNLAPTRLLEPSCGEADFLVPAVRRLLDSAASRSVPFELLGNCIRAVEIEASSLQTARTRLSELLAEYGVGESTSNRLLDDWLVRDDFLLTELDGAFTHVVGNPPYVRHESVPQPLMKEYRSRYSTIFDRADLYVPFYERSLGLLARDGQLGFICADRWLKNRYGGPLRRLVSSSFRLAYFVDMNGTDAFANDVSAYPAITVIRRAEPGPTLAAYRPQVDDEVLRTLATTLRAERPGKAITRIETLARGDDPWFLDDRPASRLVRKIEHSFPAIEETGCRVGIGVATGADRVYVADYESLDVEDDCKLPLVMAADIRDEGIRWGGRGVVNPFNADGSLVSLDANPRLRRYLEKHSDIIRNRNVGRRNPSRWYRTIDRIDPALTETPKLLIPDIKGDAAIVLDEGKFYPHHNLYFITSRDWDLPALRAVLSSGIARLFVAAYCTQMRGGFLRFQAQYLRRVRVPHWNVVSAHDRERLVIGSPEEVREIVGRLYGLNKKELDVLSSDGSNNG